MQSSHHNQLTQVHTQHNPHVQGHSYHQNTAPGAAAHYHHDHNNNLMLTAAMPLLTLISQIRHTVDHPDVTSLRSQILEEIDKTIKAIHQMGYPGEACLAAQYCLCTAIDEAVLSHDWGSNSPWVQNSLLNIKHKETWGGENFYVILEDKLKDMRSNIDFVELIYFLLSLGYEGKLHGREKHAAREEIRNRIFYRIRQARQKPDKTLSKYWKVDEPIQSTSARKRKLKRVFLATLTFVLIFGGIYNYRLNSNAATVRQELAAIGTTSPIAIFSQVIHRQIVERNHSN